MFPMRAALVSMEEQIIRNMAFSGAPLRNQHAV
jgi:hypothetical protein